MEVVATATGLVGQTDIEEILLELLLVVLDKVKCHIVEDKVGSITGIGSHDNAVLGRRREADIGIHTGILDQDAIAMLGELPDEVSAVPLDSSIDTLVEMLGTERSSECLIDIARRNTTVRITQTGDDAVIAIAIGQRVRNLAVQDLLIHRISSGAHSIGLSSRKSIGI